MPSRPITLIAPATLSAVLLARWGCSGNAVDAVSRPVTSQS